MSEKTILLIDDSATIRRLVDSELSAAGYHVVLAPTAEEGVEKAAEIKPDLIILDHQLPGTTGYEVSCQLLDNPETAHLPIVASSTLRKKAYSEYVDCDNVVDMLPKPYTPEVLVATVENALETASMVVQSQAGGSAVPEVIDQLGEADLAGNFECFSLREVIDLVNNGNKSGRLEIVVQGARVFVFTNEGRIQAVTASGIDTESFAKQLPESMSELAPVMKSTVTGKKGSEINGLVELLNNRMLDPRLLTKLLRLQAALLLKLCFQSKTLNFRFDRKETPPQLFNKLPLDSSLAALLVEAAMQTPDAELPKLEPNIGFVRRAIRGQCVDRAGLSAKHMQLLKQVGEGITLSELARVLDWSEDETLRVASGYEMADLLQRVTVQKRTVVYCVSDTDQVKQKMQALAKSHDELEIKVVSDCLALNLLLRRKQPNAILVDLVDKGTLDQFLALKEKGPEKFENVRTLATGDETKSLDEAQLAAHGFDFVVSQSAGPREMVDLFKTNEKQAELATT